MRALEKIVIDGVHYIVWDESQGAGPREKGAALLLSYRHGVGGDALLVLPKERPLAFRAYARDGREIEADDAAQRAVFRALGQSDATGATVGRVEIRLTDAFCARLLPRERHARVAG